jgi:hypothetical protein
MMARGPLCRTEAYHSTLTTGLITSYRYGRSKADLAAMLPRLNRDRHVEFCAIPPVRYLI